jgi:hypothetical protein
MPGAHRVKRPRRDCAGLKASACLTLLIASGSLCLAAGLALVAGPRMLVIVPYLIYINRAEKRS